MVLALVVISAFSFLPEKSSCVLIFSEQHASDFLIVSALEKSSPAQALESAELFFHGIEYGLVFDGFVLREIASNNFVSKKIMYYYLGRPVEVEVFITGCS